MSSPDPRIERTRRAIINATRELLLEDTDGVESLTLTAVASRAGYSRRAAYTNFTDMYGIIRAVTLDALALPIEESDEHPVTQPLPEGDLRGRIEQVLTRVNAERDLLLRIAQLPAQPALTEALLRLAREIFARGRDGMGLSDLDDIHAAFLIGGFINILRDWINGNLPGTPKTLTDTAMNIIQGIQALTQNPA